MTKHNWKDYFKPPFIGDTYVPGYIWDSDAALITSRTSQTDDACDDSIFTVERAITAVIESMNANVESRCIETDVQFSDVRYVGDTESATVYFTANGVELSLDVRSWGFLTGVKRMDNADAAAVQDDLGNFIVESINKAKFVHET